LGKREVSKSNIPNMKATKTKKKIESIIYFLKNNLKEIGFDFFTDSQQSLDDEFAKYLDGVLEKYQGKICWISNIVFRRNPLRNRN